MVVRDCTLDNGGVTKDVEIGALDHCGWVRDVKYDDVEMKGCLSVCDHDGCNTGNTKYCSCSTFLLSLLILSTHQAIRLQDLLK